ncbi:hypothetical protein J7L49_04900 [Candidatus Bathyarchaeota archaeon]|nr:hypothetical protein [Candidatus Bathyarchaeota archaeon]
MFRIMFTKAAEDWDVEGEKGKIIIWKGRTYPYNKKFEEWLRYFVGEEVEDLTFGQDRPPLFVDVEAVRGVIEIE